MKIHPSRRANHRCENWSDNQMSQRFFSSEMCVCLHPLGIAAISNLSVRISKLIQMFPLVSSFLTAKSGKSLMNTDIDGNIPLSFKLKCTFVCKRGLNMFRQRFGFEYLISFATEDSDCSGDIRGIKRFLFRNRENRIINKKIDSKLQRWPNK